MSATAKKIDELLKAVRASQRNIAVVCFVALASVWSFDGNDLEAVNSELQSIRSLASTWVDDAVWMSSWARQNTLSGPAEHALPAPLVFLPIAHETDYAYEFKNPKIYSQKIDAFSFRPLPPALSALERRAKRDYDNRSIRGLALDMPVNISEFRDFWNDLGNVDVMSRSFEDWRPGRYFRYYIADDDDDFSDRWYEENFPRNMGDVDDSFMEVVLKLEGVDQEAGEFAGFACGRGTRWCDANEHLAFNAALYSDAIISRGNGRGDRRTIAIPIRAEKHRLSARLALRSHYANKTLDVAKWSDTEFEFAFPALKRYAVNGREQLGLDDLNIVVQSDLARNPDRISVFGATIPIGDIGIWVISAVFALQLLFAAQLQELRRLLSAVDVEPGTITEPWAGLFRGVTGRIAVIAATVALPAVLSGFVSFQVLGTAVAWPICGLGITSTCVGLLAARLIWISNDQVHRDSVLL